MPVNPFRQANGSKHAQAKRQDFERNDRQERQAGRFVWINMVRPARGVMNYVGGIPPVLINFKRAILNNGTQLIESSSLVVICRLIKVCVGRPEQYEQQQFCPMRSEPLLHVVILDPKLRCRSCAKEPLYFFQSSAPFLS